jgi:UDP-2-acetamido-3-amino-2,3-dideoxy-glucuronate N-acetyltransferase
MRSLVIGTGEIGQALYEVLCDTYEGNVYKYDIKDGADGYPNEVDYLHICFPYGDDFVNSVLQYKRKIKSKYLIIHSSIPVGTAEKIEGAFHSPVRGKHPNLKDGILKYVKYVGYPLSEYEYVSEICDYFDKAGIKAVPIVETKTTELMKLLELSRYGVYIAFAKEQEAICNHFSCDYRTVVSDYEKTRNEGIEEDLKQPILYPFKDYVGGHCTIEDMEILLNQKEFPLLKEAHNIGKGTKVWGNTNIYKTAKIGKGCSIGQFCEIGNNVKIGNSVRIGAFTFIPEGVTIEDNVFIAPKVTISNDKHPPAGKEKWGKVLIKKGAVVGMGSIILPGVTIGENAVVGAGSVVTKDVADNTVVYGQAAYPHGSRKEVYEESISN